MNRTHRIDNITTDNSGCSSHIYFGNASYTLSFGHLFEGNLNNCYQSFNPLQQCYQSYSFEQPKCSCSLLNNIQSSQDYKIDKAMKTIRKSIRNVHYSIPSVPYCTNPIMTNCNQNKITKAALLLERATNTQNFPEYSKSIK